MATKAQINANRRNSKKSTGPRTAEGKEAVSQNAFKHGLFVKKAVVRDESQDEYDVHREALLAEFAPAGAMETFLAERIVNLTWRLIRAERMQNNSFDYLAMEELCGRRGQHFRTVYLNSNQIWDDHPEIPREQLLLGRLAVNDFTNYRVLEKMQLYERRLESSLHKTRAELQKLQNARKTEEKAREKSAPADDQGNLKKQSQSPAPGRESETGPSRNRANDLKKQSQFAPARNDVNSVSERDYQSTSRCEGASNKANQACPERSRMGQSIAAAPAGRTGKTKRSPGAVVR